MNGILVVNKFLSTEKFRDIYARLESAFSEDEQKHIQFTEVSNKGLASNALAMEAGNDLIMPGGGSFKKEILEGVKSGLITETDVRRCCCRVVESIMHSATQREYIG